MSDSPQEKPLLYEQHGRVGWITLNRPYIGNSMNMAMLEDLREHVLRLDLHNAINVLIFRGGGRGFCSGYDVDEIELREGGSLSWAIMRTHDLLRIFEDIRRCNIITIGQLHGYCLDGAFDLCSQFDFLIAADNCRMGWPAARCFGSTIVNTMIYNLGPQWSKYLLMTGDTVDGKYAEKIGLVIKSVPADKLESLVKDFAQRLVNVDKELLAAHKSMMGKGLDFMGLRMLQDLAGENDCIAHRTDVTLKVFNKASIKGAKAIVEAKNRGFRPQKAPFEPLESI